MGKYYAGVGARDTPETVQKQMNKIASILERKGYSLRSGGAKGADQAFEKGCTRKEIFLPSKSTPLWAKVFTDHFHPNPNALKEYPRMLMDRNALQILGRDGNTPVDFVVCWTKDGKASGGTGHALRIAEFYNIPIYNLHNPEEVDILRTLIKSL